ncbi:hypothetical protein [Rhizobium sp. GR12]|uniref:hypothetical protein n=1 Tax=Rhizobium sp. GR12 TaxID=3053925 RepID=UPI002FBEA139
MEVIDTIRWVQVKTPRGVRKALTFWASTKPAGLTMPLPSQKAAMLIANACGEGGSFSQYVHNTIVDLQAEGIRDQNLWNLHRLSPPRSPQCNDRTGGNA